MNESRKLHLEKISRAERSEDQSALRAAFADALRDLPDDPVVLGKWAEYMFGIGEKDIARQAVRKAFGLTRDDQHHLKMALCDRMYVMGMRKIAARSLPKLIPSEHPLETLIRIKILSASRDEINVRRACVQLVDRAELEPEQWREISRLALVCNAPSVAVQAFLKCIKVADATPADMARLAYLHIENNDLDSAWNVLKSLPNEVLQQPEMLAVQGICLRKSGQKTEAVETYLQLLDHWPSHASAWSGLANLADKDDLPGLVTLCEDMLNGSQEEENTDMSLRYALGVMQERLHRTRDAFESYSRANSRVHEHYVSKGRAYDAKKVEQVRARITGWFPGDMFKPHPAEVPTSQPIFIVGMPRSGTSLLERVLASLPEVRAGGESKALALVATAHHQDVLRKHAREPRALDSEAWQAMASDYWNATWVQGRFVTDKLPQNYANLGWGMKMFPTAPIIHLKRDPRDIGWSIYKRFMRVTFAYATKQESLAHAIRQCEDYMDYWKSVAPGRILTVQYEDLVQNPEPMTRNIADFCGLEWTEACLSPEKLDIPSFTLSEQQVRKPINTQGLGRWKEYEEFLQPMIRALDGYGLLT